MHQGMSVGEALAAFNAANPDAGGISSFLGKVRGGQGEVALELSHYEPLTLPGMQDLAASALERFALDGLLMWHRVGYMVPGEAIVLVAAAAHHRRGAIDAVDFCMDHLKARSWFWKREKQGGPDGGWRWIEPRSDDYHDLQRWDKAGGG